jgi:hypothetical protein
MSYTIHTFEMGVGPKDIEGLSMFAIADMARPRTRRRD